MPNKKKRASPNKNKKHTAIEHRQRGPRRAKFVASNGRIKQLIDHYHSDCSDWEDAANGDMPPPPPAAPPPPPKAPAPKAPEPAFEFTDFTKLIRFLKECAIKYISTITKGKLKFEMNEITITITKNSVKRHASELERFNVTFAICMEETHELPEDIREFFESTHCNIIQKLMYEHLISKRVRIYSLAVNGFGRDIYIASDTAVNNFLLKMKSFQDNRMLFESANSNETEDTASASPITVEDCLDGVDDDETDVFTNIKTVDTFTELPPLWDWDGAN